MSVWLCYIRLVVSGGILASSFPHLPATKSEKNIKIKKIIIIQLVDICCIHASIIVSSNISVIAKYLKINLRCICDRFHCSSRVKILNTGIFKKHQKVSEVLKMSLYYLLQNKYKQFRTNLRKCNVYYPSG